MAVYSGQLTVEFCGGPRDGEIRAIPGSTYPPELILHRAPAGLFSRHDEHEHIKLVEVVYKHSGGLWYDYAGTR